MLLAAASCCSLLGYGAIACVYLCLVSVISILCKRSLRASLSRESRWLRVKRRDCWLIIPLICVCVRQSLCLCLCLRLRLHLHLNLHLSASVSVCEPLQMSLCWSVCVRVRVRMRVRMRVRVRWRQMASDAPWRTNGVRWQPKAA